MVLVLPSAMKTLHFWYFSVDFGAGVPGTPSELVETSLQRSEWLPGKHAPQERRNETDHLDPVAKPDSSEVRGKLGCGGVAQLVLSSEPR